MAPNGSQRLARLVARDRLHDARLIEPSFPLRTLPRDDRGDRPPLDPVRLGELALESSAAIPLDQLTLGIVRQMDLPLASRGALSAPFKRVTSDLCFESIRSTGGQRCERCPDRSP